jgi:hypothetical protein
MGIKFISGGIIGYQGKLVFKLQEKDDPPVEKELANF